MVMVAKASTVASLIETAQVTLASWPRNAYQAEYDSSEYEVSAYDMTETPDDPEFDDGELFAHLASQGLDVDDEEALEYAAEIIQTEREAFFARHRAFKKGFKGSKGKGSGKSSTPPSSRHFDVQGQLSLSERQQRVQSLKSRTTCRKCGQVGHWSGDFICPKNNKGGKSGPGSSASSSAPTKSSASAGRGAKDGKPRTVYFGIKSDDGYSRKSYMAMRYNAVPPPSCLSDGQAPPEQATGSSPGEWSVVSDGHHMTQDELDNIMLVEALGVPEIRDDELQSMVDFVARNESVATPDARLLMLEALQHQQQHGHVALQLLPRAALPPLPGRTSLSQPQDQPEQVVSSAPSMSSAANPPDGVPEAHAGCEHKRTTFRGSNAYYTFKKCLDCEAVLLRERKELPPRATPKAAAAATTTAAQMTAEQEACPHQSVTWAGSNGHR